MAIATVAQSGGSSSGSSSSGRSGGSNGSSSGDPLAIAIRQYIDGLAANYSIGIGVGYVDSSRELGMGAGNRSNPDSNVTRLAASAYTENSTAVLGSGTKPYVAAAVMRLVDRGLVSLVDKAAKHANGPVNCKHKL